MKQLHIFRSKPTDKILQLTKSLSQDNETTQFPLYEEAVDYDRLVELIFSHDKVISWW
jgi:hypothetical protein